MTEAIQFSIATPCRNSLSKLRRCVGSIRGQTGVSVEHLIQDAASTDGTAGWLAGQATIKAVVESDEGMYDAINRAWARAKGQVIAWLNADEQYLPGTLQKVFTFFESHPEVDIVFGNYIVVDGDGWPIALRREIPFRRIYVSNSFLNLQSCTLFFRRSLLDHDRLLFNPRYRYAADADLILRLVKEGATIRHIPEYLSLFGVDGENLSNLAAEESALVHRLHGSFRFAPLRHLVVAGRRIERMMRGCYRKTPISYYFATDEKPCYVKFAAESVGGRYKLSSTGTAEESTHTPV